MYSEEESTNGAEWLTDLHRRAEQARETGEEAPQVCGPDGLRFTVQADPPRGNYGVLLEGEGEAEGVAVALVSAFPNNPDVQFQFSARACWNASSAELAEWARRFLSKWSLPIERTVISRCDLYCDLPERLPAGARSCCAGTWARKGKLTRLIEETSEGGSGRVVDFRYKRSGGKSRPLIFRIYDRRHKERESDAASIWPALWDRYGIDDDTEIWRVEFEGSRRRLRERGLDTWDDLTPRRLAAFWSYATEDFFKLMEAPAFCEERNLSDFWEAVQSASDGDSAPRIEVEPPKYNRDKDLAQTVGMLRRMLRKGEDVYELLGSVAGRLDVDEKRLGVKLLDVLDTGNAAVDAARAGR